MFESASLNTDCLDARGVGVSIRYVRNWPIKLWLENILVENSIKGVAKMIRWPRKVLKDKKWCENSGISRDVKGSQISI